MRYNPRTDQAIDIDVIAEQCMNAVIAATGTRFNRDDEYHGAINYGNSFPEDWYWMGN